MLFLILSLCISSTIGIALKHPDEIHNLPGMNFEINFKQYAGYLNATEGKYLHYWFVESQRSPENDPLMLWLNGGPGFSSLAGLLTELGPFHINSDGETLHMNPFSWNNVANVIFLEAPAGVGFSYSQSKNYSTDDDTTSEDNYVALQSFFKKFPQFKKNDFYITGESYGGIYIPTLSVRVLTGPADINFKGFAIGNGYLDVQNLTNSVFLFYYYHGLIGPALWKELSNSCCVGPPSESTCNFANPETSPCQQATHAVAEMIQDTGLNVYNLYSECADSTGKMSRDVVDRRILLELLLKDNPISYRSNYGTPCIDSSNITHYFNQPSVRRALNVPDTVQQWESCSSIVFQGYKTIYSTMRPQILQLLNSNKLRGLIYNGDVDMACNFLGDEWFTRNLNLLVIKNYGVWKYNNQIAGFVNYYQNLTFLTVKGSGHMVPHDKPGQALKMITSFLSDKPY